MTIFLKGLESFLFLTTYCSICAHILPSLFSINFVFFKSSSSRPFSPSAVDIKPLLKINTSAKNVHACYAYCRYQYQAAIRSLSLFLYALHCYCESNSKFCVRQMKSGYNQVLLSTLFCLSKE